MFQKFTAHFGHLLAITKANGGKPSIGHYKYLRAQEANWFGQPHLLLLFTAYVSKDWALLLATFPPLSLAVI
uniref:IP07302p n=1 Tax=Drosophila melanogaster TaxID=7227 RepID=Q29QM5_DROME|nr:IP07302p [Drosophila melanogaster]